MKTSKRFCVFMLVIVMLLFTGCWNYREVNDMAMVAGFAIDKGNQGHKYHLTFEFVDLSTPVPGSKLLETDGDTIFEGIRNCIAKSGKKLYFSHTKIIIISKQIAKEGLAPVLDFIMRDNELRLTIGPIISKEKTAKEILQKDPITNKLSSTKIWKALIENSLSLSDNPAVTLYQAINMLGEDGLSLILPTVKAPETQSESTPELDGSAVFKKDKLVGFLNRKETKFLLFIKNQVKGGLIVTSSNDKNPNMTFEILDNETKITPLISKKDLTMKVDIKTNAVLVEDQTHQYDLSEDGIKRMQNRIEKVLKKGIPNVINKVQNQYNSDIFGFGNTIYHNKPKYWVNVKPNWDDSFPTLKFDVSAEVIIVNLETAKSKIKVGD